MEGTISTIIVAVITGIVTIVNTVISKRTSKKVDSISDLKKDIADMREESKKDILEHTLDADKTFLINFLSEHMKFTRDIVKIGGNSYVHDKWEEVKRKGLL